MGSGRQRRRGERQPAEQKFYETGRSKYAYSFSHEPAPHELPIERVLDEISAPLPSDTAESTVGQTVRSVPLALFQGSLPALQALVLYLRERRGLSYREMAALLGRAESTLRATYRNASKADPERSIFSPLVDDVLGEEFGIRVPLSLFSLGLSPLETVLYSLLKRGLRNVEIAALLNLDPRTTWTVARRIKQKGVVLT